MTALGAPTATASWRRP